jgi:hypothetical protein
MKGHKAAHHGRKHRASGGVNEMAEDAHMKTERRNIAPKIFGEAEARKHGGRAKKEGGKVHGEAAKHHAGRMPRKSGGRTGSNMNPLSSAAAGTPGKGRNVSGSLD